MSKLTLQDLKAKPISLELKHPVNGEPLGVTVEIVGKNSRQFRDKFFNLVGDAQLEGENKKTTAEKMKVAEQQGIELIATCIVGWTDEEFFGGAYSAEKALEIVSSPELSWVRQQVDDALGEESRFFTQ